MRDVSLDVLDQSLVRRGRTAAQALHKIVELARAAEAFGYAHDRAAAHHNRGGFAETVPEVLMGRIAANTSTIRVGSGGVMLSPAAALKVAETVRLVVDAFSPARVAVA